MGALRHVVMVTLHDSVQAARFKATLDACRQLVPGILEFEVGIRQAGLDASCDVVLVSTFADKAALDAYLAHPHHQQVAAMLAPLRSVRMVLDYDIDTARRAAARVPPVTTTAQATASASTPAPGTASPPAGEAPAQPPSGLRAAVPVRP